MSPQAAYEELLRRSRDRALLTSCLEVIGWDELTYMPHGGVENRGRQTAYLAGLLHQTWTDPRLGELLGDAEDALTGADLESPAAVNLREWRRMHDRSVRVPRSLVQEIAAVTTTAQQAWADARRDDDFRLFLPELERVVHLKRQEAGCLGGDAYDALLDEYEPGAKSVRLDQLFEALRREMVPLIAAIAAAPRRKNPAVLHRSYPPDRQRLFIEAVAGDVGFDLSRGRLDVTTHPFFSAVGPGDCRITTRFQPNDFGEGFFAALHELGHGLYEQGLDVRHHGTPFGESCAMAVHESQSRLWENFIGRSLPFWKHFFPRARETFHDALHGVKLADFHRAVNHVQPGVNRVRADAATYDLHILIRYQLEKAMISGDLPPSELPAAWNHESQQLLGVVPESDSEGCLQDGHWGAGQFGYFPTYTLGNLYAAQFFSRMRTDIPHLDRQLSDGEFQPLRGWLHDRIYRHGRRYASEELLEHVTGSPLDHHSLVNLLRERYVELYGL